MLCDCGATHYVGKSLGEGIYSSTPPGKVMESLHEWMWEHLIECDHPNATYTRPLGREWAKGEVFKVVTEYDDRVGGHDIPPFASPPKETHD